MSENASIVKVTSLMAGDGVVLLKLYDLFNNQTAIQRPWLWLGLLVIPPVAGLICGVASLGLIELRTYRATGTLEQWLSGISMGGIGLPLGLWALEIAKGIHG